MKKKPARGRFITFEGLEGVGKSTHVEFVNGWLRAQGLTVVVTREPGGTPEADEIRSTLLKVRGAAFDPMAELLLMFAARALHVENVIRPALANGVDARSGSFSLPHPPLILVPLLDKTALRGVFTWRSSRLPKGDL